MKHHVTVTVHDAKTLWQGGGGGGGGRDCFHEACRLHPQSLDPLAHHFRVLSRVCCPRSCEPGRRRRRHCLSLSADHKKHSALDLSHHGRDQDFCTTACICTCHPPDSVSGVTTQLMLRTAQGGDGITSLSSSSQVVYQVE